MTTDNSVELALRDPQPSLPAPAEFDMMRAMAEAICKTEFVPKGLRGRPEAALATLMYGREMGIGPMQAMSRIHIIEGHPTLAAELILGLIRNARKGHTIVSSSVSPQVATITAKRGDTGEEMTVSFTVEEARAAGLAGKDNWKNYPADMCWARCVSRLGRRLFSDALYGGVYTPEDFGQREGEGYITQGDITAAGVVAGLVGFVARPDDPNNLPSWGIKVKQEVYSWVRKKLYPDREQLTDDEKALVIADAQSTLTKALSVVGIEVLDPFALTESEAVAIFEFIRTGTAPDRDPDPTVADFEDAEIVEPGANPAQDQQVLDTSPVDRALREQQWSEVVELCRRDIGLGTAKDVEGRVRKLYRLMGNLGVWPGQAGHDQFHVDLGVHLDQPPRQVHWSDLGVKAKQIQFARKAQAKAQRALAEQTGD